MLEVKNVTKVFYSEQYGNLTALENVSLFVEKGEFVSIIGPSGCGKSTLLEMIAGLLKPTSGDICLNGQSITGKKGAVAYMPQKDVLFPWRTIIENVTIPLEIQGVKKARARQEALALLPIFGLEKFADHYPDMLSGGMRQRANFLRTFLFRKELMLLDEPFGKLDALTKMQMHKWLLTILEQLKQTVLLVTHDIEEAILLSDRIYVFSPRPGTIKGEVIVPLNRPRTQEMITSSTFIEIKKTIIEFIKGLT
ncbi:ABC transporter ATP-binding protein [Bacillus alveayuensis]|uniref:ABC transporter ATP-binding protein n=1 Tax=Aeribacillus alveayuensis TaxID=279215 RepID=UPI0005D0EFE9|nr:ABC transporter ATP-binding protein [Bacillus alveayuensis]